MKLRNKIHLYTTVLFLGLLIFMNITIYFLFKNLMVESEISATEQEIKNIMNGITSSLGSIPPDELLRAYLPVDGGVKIVTPEGNIKLMVISPDEKGLDSAKNTFYPKEHRELANIADNHYQFHSIPVIWTDGAVMNLQVLKNVETPFAQSKSLRTVLFSVTLIAMIPIYISSRLLSNIIIQPINSLIQTMNKVKMSGKFQRIQAEGGSRDELFQMADTFNNMMDLLETNFSKQEQFISNASHELKTPLTVIESYASLLKRRGLENPDVFQESVEAIHSEAGRMRELTEQLLMLAKPQESWTVKMTEFSPDSLIQNAIKSFEKAFNRTIKYKSEDDIIILSDKEKLKQLLYIILDNALKYSKEHITITSGTENQMGYIRIIDRGMGISQNELSRIFDRFYRVDKARSRSIGGTGLGLSLAREIADALDAKIHIESAVGVGTNVTIYLPLTTEHHPEN